MADAAETASGENLIHLLAQERDRYQRLQELAERQRALISGDRPERLLDLLHERQSLVAELTELNARLGPFRRDWGETCKSLSDDLRAQAAAMVEEITAAVTVIQKVDHEDSALLSARKQSIGNQASKVSGAKVANTAYGRQTQKVTGKPAADLTG